MLQSKHTDVCVTVCSIYVQAAIVCVASKLLVQYSVFSLVQLYTCQGQLNDSSLASKTFDLKQSICNTNFR